MVAVNFMFVIVFNFVQLVFEMRVSEITTAILIIFLYINTDPGTPVHYYLTKVSGAPQHYYTAKEANEGFIIILRLILIFYRQLGHCYQKISVICHYYNS